MKGVLVDSTGKKIDAVKEFIDKLKLSNVTAKMTEWKVPNLLRNIPIHLTLS